MGLHGPVDAHDPEVEVGLAPESAYEQMLMARIVQPVAIGADSPPLAGIDRLSWDRLRCWKGHGSGGRVFVVRGVGDEDIQSPKLRCIFGWGH